MAFLDHWLLTIVLLLPAAGGGAVLLVRRSSAVRWTALAVSLGTLALSLLILSPFKWQRAGSYSDGPGGTVQMVCRATWIAPIHAQYLVAVDGLSFPLLVLAALVGVLCCAASWNVDKDPSQYFAGLLLLDSTILGVLESFDLLLLLIFLAFSLVSAWYLVARFGGPRRSAAAGKLLFYLLGGLLCLLVMLTGVYAASERVFGAGTLDLTQLASAPMRQFFAAPMMAGASRTLFVLGLVAFIVRLPIVPFHAWLADVLSEAPAPISWALLALIPITGIYGLIRVAYAIFPHAARELWIAVAILGVITILYGALCALAHDNLRKTLAHGSVSLAGFMLMGISTMTLPGTNAAIFIAIAAAVTTGMLVLLAAGKRENTGASPLIAGFLTAAWLAYLLVPGFFGQALVLLGCFGALGRDSPIIPKPAPMLALVAAACLGMILTAAYVLNSLRAILSAAPRPEAPSGADLSRRDLAVLIPVLAVAIGLLLFPTALCFTFTQRALEAIFH